MAGSGIYGPRMSSVTGGAAANATGASRTGGAASTAGTSKTKADAASKTDYYTSSTAMGTGASASAGHSHGLSTTGAAASTARPPIPKAATASKDWEEIGLHLAAKADSTTFKQTDVKSHIEHHLDDGVTLRAIAGDNRFTQDERSFAAEKATGQEKYSSVMNDMNRYWNFYASNGQADVAKASAFAKELEMFDGQAGISDADRAKADQVAKDRGIQLLELGPKGHDHPPAPPPLQPGEISLDDILKTYRNADKANARNLSQTDLQKLVDGNQKMSDLMKKATQLGLPGQGSVLKSGVEDLAKKADKNVSVGKYLVNNFTNMALTDLNKTGGNIQTLSVDDVKSVAANDQNATVVSQGDQTSQLFKNFAGIFQWFFNQLQTLRGG